MGEYIHILSIPVFTITMLIEWWAARNRKDIAGYERRDTAASLSMGVGSLIVAVGSDLILINALKALNTLSPIPTLSTAHWWSWVLAMIAVDFTLYWSHRFHHEVRVLWAAHVNHHSSEHYNLSTALRQSWTERYTGLVFYIPLGLLGFSPELVTVSFAINLLYQYWVHTELIDRMGPFEWVMNTPSHHRVHHGSNLRYLDRNYGGILIIWDRMFGTFQVEDEKVVYGLTKNIHTYNPFRIAFHEWVAVFRDATHARGLGNALRYLFAPPGWSPDGSSKTAQQLQKELGEHAQQGEPAE